MSSMVPAPGTTDATRSGLIRLLPDQMDRHERADFAAVPYTAIPGGSSHQADARRLRLPVEAAGTS